MDNLINHFTNDFQGTLRAALRFIHFIGLAVGLGGATLLDLMLLKYLVPNRVTEENAQFFAFASKIVNLGLKVLWLSGIGFLLYYSQFDPQKLSNPKIYAKLTIVLALTLNGLFIHAYFIAFLRRQIGKPLLSGVGRKLHTAFVMSGAISIASWYSPVVLGVFWQFNMSVPATTILALYVSLIAVAALFISVVLRLLTQYFHKAHQNMVT